MNLVITIQGDKATSVINGLEYVTNYPNKQHTINGHKMRWVIENNPNILDSKGKLIGDPSKIIYPEITINANT